MAGTLQYPSISPPGPPAGIIEAPFPPNEEETVSWEHAGPLVSEETTVATPAPDRLTERLMAEFAQDLEQKLGRSPSVQEMAEAAHVTEERLLQAMEVNRTYAPCSLDTCLYGRDGSRKGPVSECIGEDDAGIQFIEERDALRQAVTYLNDRQQQIIQLRFYDEMSQAEVAKQIGISQMHVSRLERQALRDLQRILTR